MSELDELYRAYAESIKTRGIDADLLHPVFGEGPNNATLMLIGEAPGANEAEQSRAFVGKAGKQLDAFLVAVGLRREQIFITNAVKYRPYKNEGKKNRTPTRQELDEGCELLMHEIALVRPRVIATLGNSSLYAVTGDRKLTIGVVHGTVRAFSLNKQNIMLFPLYHPASVIYNPTLSQVYEQDLCKLKILIEQLDHFDDK